MIRRDSTSSASESQWILISQIEHAHLAGELARHWGAVGFPPLEPREELLWAIAHHDDGWSEWDSAPGVDPHSVDPHSGVPRSFTEMEIADSLAIWSRSIATALEEGPLQAYLVAGHFCALARRVSAWMKDDARKRKSIEFIDDYENRMAGWLAAWQSVDPTGNTLQVAKLGILQVQFFDVLSLWFCCSEAAEAEEVQVPAGPILSLVPLGGGSVTLNPWPFAFSPVNFEVHGRCVPARPYRDREDLAAVSAKPVTLRWQLQAAAEKV